MSRANWPTCFDTFFHALAHVGGDVMNGSPTSGSQWKAKCPAHEDNVHSLSIGLGRKGNLILRCHSPAGCPTDEICRSIGVTLRDLYPDEADRKRADEERWKREQELAAAAMSGYAARYSDQCYRGVEGYAEVQKPAATDASAAIPTKYLDRPQQTTKPKGASVTGRKTVKVYDYRDEKGNLVFQVCRTDPKGFYQRRPNPQFDGSQPETHDGNPRFINNLQGVVPILYKLPEMLAAWAVNPKKGVFIVEGEKDADLLHAAGLLGTTNCAGVGKWRKEYTEALRGRSVVIIPDEDPTNEAGYSPGVRHAYEVANALVGVASSVRVLHLPGVPPKGDFTDWWTLNHDPNVTIETTKNKFAALVVACPVFAGNPQYGKAGQAPAAQSQAPANGQQTLPTSPPPAPPPVVPTPPPALPPVPPVPPPAPAPVVPPVAAVAKPTPPAEGKGMRPVPPNTFRFLEHAEAAAATMRAQGVTADSAAELLVVLQAGVRRLEAAVHASVYGNKAADPAAEVNYALGMIGGGILLGLAEKPDPAGK